MIATFVNSCRLPKHSGSCSAHMELTFWNCANDHPSSAAILTKLKKDRWPLPVAMSGMWRHWGWEVSRMSRSTFWLLCLHHLVTFSALQVATVISGDALVHKCGSGHSFLFQPVWEKTNRGLTTGAGPIMQVDSPANVIEPDPKPDYDLQNVVQAQGSVGGHPRTGAQQSVSTEEHKLRLNANNFTRKCITCYSDDSFVSTSLNPMKKTTITLGLGIR